MKAFDESPRALAHPAGLILLFDGEVDSALRNHDEHSPADILTWGLEPYSRLPDPACGTSGSSPGPPGEWKLVALYSGATVPDSHGVP